jgi:hypothetical protein
MVVTLRNPRRFGFSEKKEDAESELESESENKDAQSSRNTNCCINKALQRKKRK